MSQCNIIENLLHQPLRLFSNYHIGRVTADLGRFLPKCTPDLSDHQAQQPIRFKPARLT